MTQNYSDRAVGQYFRNAKIEDGWHKLFLVALHHANRDARNIKAPQSPNRKFQPGVATPQAELDAEEENLRDWIESDQLIDWCLYVGKDPDIAREQILRSLDGLH